MIRIKSRLSGENFEKKCVLFFVLLPFATLGIEKKTCSKDIWKITATGIFLQTSFWQNDLVLLADIES